MPKQTKKSCCLCALQRRRQKLYAMSSAEAAQKLGQLFMKLVRQATYINGESDHAPLVDWLPACDLRSEGNLSELAEQMWKTASKEQMDRFQDLLQRLAGTL